MFTKVKISDLSTSAINYLIAKLEGENTAPQCWNLYNYDTDYNSVAHIIEREQISFAPAAQGGYFASIDYDGKCVKQWGENLIISALKCIIAFHLGEEVSIPNSLIK